jgi:hypothetical protein
VDTAVSSAGGALNLGSGVFDLIRGNVPAGLKEALSGAGQLGTTAARALAPGTADVVGNVAGLLAVSKAPST